MQYNFKKLFFHIILFSFVFTFSCENKKSYYNGMVSSVNPIASQVGLDVLKSGGNAFDAAIAVHFTLAVVYPQAGNLGGEVLPIIAMYAFAAVKLLPALQLIYSSMTNGIYPNSN